MSTHENRYMLTYIGPEHLARGYFLPSKEVAETKNMLDVLLSFIEKHGWCITIHGSDRGEFMADKYIEELRDQGIHIETMICDSLQQNGVSEKIY